MCDPSRAVGNLNLWTIRRALPLSGVRRPADELWVHWPVGRQGSPPDCERVLL